MKTAHLLLIFSFALLSGCWNKGVGYNEPTDYETADFGSQLYREFPGVFRGSKASLTLDRSVLSTKKNPDPSGYIPMVYGIDISRRDICNRRRNPDCVSFIFGSEILKHPEVFEKIKNWMLNPCDNLPKIAPEVDEDSYAPFQARQRDLERLRKFMSCDSEKKKKRQIFIYIMRDFDELFSRKTRSRQFDDLSEVQPFIIQQFVLTVNP